MSTLDELVREQADRTPIRDDIAWDAGSLWQRGQTRRRRARLAYGAVGTALTALLVGGGLLAIRPEQARSRPALVAPARPLPTPVESALDIDLDRAARVVARGRGVSLATDAEAMQLVDARRTLADIGTARITVVALPGRDLAGGDRTAQNLADEVGARSGRSDVIVILLAGRTIAGAAGSGTRLPQGTAAKVIGTAVQDHFGEFSAAHVQGALDEAIGALKARLATATPARTQRGA